MGKYLENNIKLMNYFNHFAIYYYIKVFKSFYYYK